MRVQQILDVALGWLSMGASTPATLSSRPSSYVAPAGFPTSAFASYYNSPVKPTEQPQPIIHDPVLNITFPYNLTNPHTIPDSNSDQLYYPEPIENLSEEQSNALIEEAVANITEIIQSNTTDSKCTKCKNALAIAKTAALHAPTLVPKAMVSLCKRFHFKSKSNCKKLYSESTAGATWPQVLAYADVQGLDGDYICSSLKKKSFCGMPQTSPLDTTNLFPKPKPAHVSVPKASGQRVKVLHLSDLHLDSRYAVNSEAKCSADMCCRENQYNSAAEEGQILLPAPAYGAFTCDSSYDLVLATLQAIGPLTGTGESGDSLAWTLYTGDLVSHDDSPQLSLAYVEYTETSVYSMLKSFLTGPVFSALGNHDSSPADIALPYGIPGRLGEQQSWNYDHVSGMWQHEGWIDEKTAAEARTHYGGYSVKTHYGLRIISFNTDFWYTHNFLNFINTTNPDNSGIFSWMISELQSAEDTGERVWIMGHVPSGWDAKNLLPDPTNLFYQIVDRYSPHVIANVFFGHTHEDQFSIFYANNGTVQNAESALMTSWMAPSVTPLHNMNTAFRLYEVDTGDFNVYEAYTFYSNVSEYPSLRETGPTFRLEYSTRDTYGPAAGWDADAPLNATFWHRVTEGMEKDLDLVTQYNELQGKLSIKSPECTTPECQHAKICYMRSGSFALGSQCPKGYGSVQSDFKVKK